MKRKCSRRKGKILLSKKNTNSSLNNIFKSSSQSNLFLKTTLIKNNISPLTKSEKNSNKMLYIIRNPSKNRILEEAQEELKKFHNLAEKTILCDSSLVNILYEKICPSFEKIERFLSNYKKCSFKNINKKEILIKFILQLKYTNIVYLSPSLLSETFNEENISQNIKNFVGFNNNKGVTMNFHPNTKKECEIFWPNITKIISDYLKDFHEGKGLYLYIKHDYISYLDKIKLLCNLNNYETTVIDETNESKNIILDKLSEAMQTKRLPSISEQLGIQMLMLEEMVNNFSFKWEIFTNNNDKGNNKDNKDKFYSNNINNNINNINFNFLSETKNDEIIKSNKDLDILLDKDITIEIKKNDEFEFDNNEKFIKIDEESKNDQLSTNEAISNNNKKKENNNIINKSKSKDKKREKSKHNSRNKSNDKKRQKNKKIIEDDINNTNIKGYFNENTKEHKTFIQLQNNIFLYCTKAKTAIIIVDSLSDEDKDKKYFNNILLKISQTKCPIIILTNNMDYIINNTQKKIKNLDINCILNPKNKREILMIYLYNFIIYINIKLCSLKFIKNIKTYEQILEYINNLDTDSDEIKYDLCISNLNKIYNISEYFCYKGKFQFDIIDLRLSEIFLEVEEEINYNNINPNDFENILNYLYNIIFSNENNFSIDSEEKTIEDIYNECELRSFFDYSEGVQNHLINKNYETKLNLNDSFEEFCKSKDSMVNLEGLLINKYFDENKLLSSKSKDNNNNNNLEKNYSSYYNTFDNKIINEIHKQDQLMISYYKKKYILLTSIKNYIFPIKRIVIIHKNLIKKRNIIFFTDFSRKNEEEYNIFIDMHNFKKIFQKIDDNYFLNKNNFNYAINYMIKKTINQKKILANFYEK